MTKRASKRTSRRRTSRRTSSAVGKRRAASLPAPFNYLVDTYDGFGKTEARTEAAAMKIAKTHGKHDQPSVVWKRTRFSEFRPHRVVVEGKILK